MLSALFGKQPGQGHGLALHEAVEKADRGEIHLLDVRDHAEVAASGKARGAIHIPLSVLRFQADPKGPDLHPELSRDKPVAVYCASGARSQQAIQILAAYDYEAYNIGGFGHWQRAGGPVAA